MDILIVNDKFTKAFVFKGKDFKAAPTVIELSGHFITGDLIAAFYQVYDQTLNGDITISGGIYKTRMQIMSNTNFVTVID